MKIPFRSLPANKRLEHAVVLSIVFFLFRIVFQFTDKTGILIANEVLFVLTAYFWLLYFIAALSEKRIKPMSIAFNTGIIIAFNIFVVAIANAAVDDWTRFTASASLIINIIFTLVSFIFILSASFVLASFRALFLLQQKKDPRNYFNVMLFFFMLSMFALTMNSFSGDVFSFVETAFFIVTIILISINSLRVAWIAFLNKKEKITLLFFSILLLSLFTAILIVSMDSDFTMNLLGRFAKSLPSYLLLVNLYGVIYFSVIFFTTLFHLPTAEAFDRKAEEVSSLIDLSKLITRAFDEEELLKTVTSLSVKVCNSDISWLAVKTVDDLEIRSVNGIGFKEADRITGMILPDDYKSIDDFTEVAIEQVNQINTAAFVPIKIHGALIGFLFIAKKEKFGFDDDDIQSIKAFADYVAVAFENAELIKKSIEKERLQKELDVAREVQYKIVPSESPKHKNIDVAFGFLPAFEVGGDYYDFFLLPNDKFFFIIADVSGKGISAAFIMAELRGIISSLVSVAETPKDLLIKTNNILKGRIDKKSFITASCGLLDMKSGKMKFVRAGHMPMLKLSGNEITEYAPGGLGLAINYTGIFDESIEELDFQLNNNDIVILFTDGVTEAHDENLNLLGTEKLKEFILVNPGASVAELSSSIMKGISEYTRLSSQYDDITYVLIKWKKSI
ncbi:MAG: SpoIIE family protein phosphatase [Chlorobi bacterium]|nr:SpoIIE family protein phosphatase [Chlorobiota bacterium]